MCVYVRRANLTPTQSATHPAAPVQRLTTPASSSLTRTASHTSPSWTAVTVGTAPAGLGASDRVTWAFEELLCAAELLSSR